MVGLPGWVWIYDHADYWKGSLWQKISYMLHVLMILISIFLTIRRTYVVILQIIDAYKDGTVSSSFLCADNSNSS